MAEPMTPDEMAAQLDRANQARALASQYLSPAPNQSVAPIASFPGDMPPPPAPAPAPPPSPPPGPAKPSGWDRAKDGALGALATAGGFIVGGPAGAIAAGQAVNPQPRERIVLPTEEEKATKKAEDEAKAKDAAAGPRGPIGSTDEPPIMLNSGRGIGVPQLVRPAGMFPQSDSVQVREGKMVPQTAKSAYDAMTEYEVGAAEKERDAVKAFQQNVYDTNTLRMEANDQAIKDHARVQAEREALVKQKLAQIEQTNADAAADIDPDKYWTDRGALSRVIGGLAVALGAFGSSLSGGPNAALTIIENAINRDIDAQKANRAGKVKKGEGQMKLLDLHEEALGSQDKAIEATKMGLWDNANSQLQRYAAKHGIDMADANYQKLMAGIAERRGESQNKLGIQEQADITKQSTQTWRDAAYSYPGGGAGKADKHEDDPVVAVPASDSTGDKTRYVRVPKDVHPKMVETMSAISGALERNKAALELRTKYAEAAKKRDRTAMVSIYKDLKNLTEDQAVAVLKAGDPTSAARDPEVERVLKSGVDFTTGIDPDFDFAAGNSKYQKWRVGDVELRTRRHSNNMLRFGDAKLRGANGEEVKWAIGRDAEGRPVRKYESTGMPYKGRPVTSEDPSEPQK